MAILQWVSERWLDGLRTRLTATAKAIKSRSPDYSETDDDGDAVAFSETGETEPNPEHLKLQRIIEAAEYHLATKNRIIEKATKEKFKPNSYAGTCSKTGEAVKAGAGFVRNDAGKWVTYSRAAVIAILGITVDGLPDIEE